MKKIGLFPLFLAALLVLCTVDAAAQDVPEKEFRTVLKSNPFYAVAGWVPMSWEQFIGKNKSFVIGASYITNEPAVFSNVNKAYDSRSGFYINPAFRFYLLKTAGHPGGFYASPEVGFIQQERVLNESTVIVYRDKEPFDSYEMIYPKKKLTMQEYQVGATIGYQAVVHDVFVLDLYAGEGLGFMQFSGNADAFYEHLNAANYSNRKRPKDGSRLMAGFKIGVAF